MSRGTTALRQSLRILRPFWRLGLFATVIGGLSGVASAALIATINRALHAEGQEMFAVLLAFGALFMISVLGEAIGNIGNSAVGQNIIAWLRKDLSGRILSAPIAEIERFKQHRLLAALDQDVSTIGHFTFNFTTLAIAVAIAIGCFFYLAVLSPAMFAVALPAVAIDGILQAAVGRAAAKRFDGARSAHDDLQKHYLTIMNGAKELRLNRDRRTRLRDEHLNPAIDKIRDQFLGAVRIFFVAKSFNSAVFFASLLAALLFGRQSGVDSSALSGFVLVLLFVRGPIEQLVAALPLLGEAKVSFGRVTDLCAVFRAIDGPLLAKGEGRGDFDGEAIKLRNVRYEFPVPDGGAPFALGPLNLTIKRGETLFIVGGNGSGKTTLIKLLLGLYLPSAGEVRCDGRCITPDQADDYRQLFSAIFFDYFLFEDIVAHDSALPIDIVSYLHMLGLADKVMVRDGQFSTTDLSSGQRKRLALIHVLLERRPIVVLDEWTADQDPEFRWFFYRELLPMLKRMGKTVIAVSHDDRFFDHADRLIRLEGGQVIEEGSPRRAAGRPRALPPHRPSQDRHAHVGCGLNCETERDDNLFRAHGLSET